MVLTGTELAYCREDGVLVVPVGRLRERGHRIENQTNYALLQKLCSSSRMTEQSFLFIFTNHMNL